MVGTILVAAGIELHPLLNLLWNANRFPSISVAAILDHRLAAELGSHLWLDQFTQGSAIHDRGVSCIQFQFLFTSWRRHSEAGIKQIALIPFDAYLSGYGIAVTELGQFGAKLFAHAPNLRRHILAVHPCCEVALTFFLETLDDLGRILAVDEVGISSALNVGVHRLLDVKSDVFLERAKLERENLELILDGRRFLRFESFGISAPLADLDVESLTPMFLKEQPEIGQSFNRVSFRHWKTKFFAGANPQTAICFHLRRTL